MKKIIEIGHTPRSPGAMGYDGITEYSRNKELAERILLWMDYFRCNTDIMEGSTMGIKGVDSEIALSRVVQKFQGMPKGSNFSSVHHNNDFPGATGTEGYISTKSTMANKRRAEWIIYHVANVIGIPVRQHVSTRIYKYSKESYRGRLALLDDVTNIEGILIEPYFLNNIDIPKAKGKEDEIAYIIALGTIYDFKKKTEPQYQLVKQYQELRSLKPGLPIETIEKRLKSYK